MVLVYIEGNILGPFNTKWGALTVALWSVKEAKGNDGNLTKWVVLGPKGIIALANNHLSKDLKVKFNSVFKW